MTTITPPRLHHLALTVTDVEASLEWYEAVFSVRLQADVPHQGGVGKLLMDEQRQLMIVLHHHDGNDGELFGETVTGLDHAGFMLPARSDLEAWQDHLESVGVVRAGTADKPLTQSPIADEPYGSVLVFRDPDNIQLISGAMLQLALIIALSATMMTLDALTITSSFFVASGLWILIAVIWKFLLALVSDDPAEVILRALIPVSHFFFFLFWPILAPIRRLRERWDREDDEAHEEEEVTDEEVQAFIDVGEEEGILEASEGRLIQQIVDFGDRVARELMAVENGPPKGALARGAARLCARSSEGGASYRTSTRPTAAFAWKRSASRRTRPSRAPRRTS